MLSVKQRRAINAILTCRTLEAAAREVKVTSKTLHRWMNDPEFMANLRQAEDTLIDETRRRLAAGRSLAIDTLEELMKSRSETTRRQAVNSWLDYDLKYGSKDIEARLTALEERIYGGPERTKTS